jgi:hypothetical protein
MSVHFSEGFQAAFDVLFGLTKEAGSGALATRMAIRAATKPTGLARKVVSSTPVPSMLEKRIASRGAQRAAQRQQLSPGALARTQAEKVHGKTVPGKGMLDWVKKNPGTTAVGALGAAGGATYLGTRDSAQQNPPGAQQYYSPYNY